MNIKLLKCERIMKQSGHFIYRTKSMFEKLITDVDIYMIVMTKHYNKIQKQMKIINTAMYRYENSEHRNMNNKKQCDFLIDAITIAKNLRGRICMWSWADIGTELKSICIRLKYTKEFITYAQYDFEWLRWVMNLNQPNNILQDINQLSDSINLINKKYIFIIDEIIYTDVRPMCLDIIYKHDPICRQINDIYQFYFTEQYKLAQNSGLMNNLLFDIYTFPEVLCYIVLQYACPFILNKIMSEINNYMY